MSNDKAAATAHPNAPQGWDRTDPREWAPVPATKAVPVVQQTVVVQADRRRPNHLLHLVLTILTAGLWLPVWIIRTIGR